MSDLLELCRAGDRKARKELYEKYVDKVFGLSLRIMKNREAAEDATQDVFVKVFSRIDQFRHEAEVGTWIYRITSNVCFDVLKSSHSKLLPFDEEMEHSMQDTSESGNEHTKGKGALEQQTRKVLRTINTEWAKTFWLFTMEQLSQKEIAVILKISVPTVKMRLARVRETLRIQINRNDL